MSKGAGDGRGKIGSATGDVGSDGVENALCDGTAPRVRDCAAHRTGERRSSGPERGDGVHRAAPATTARMDRFEVGDERKQPEGAILLHHEARREATGARDGELGTGGGCDGPGAEARKTGVMPCQRCECCGRESRVRPRKDAKTKPWMWRFASTLRCWKSATGRKV